MSADRLTDEQVVALAGEVAFREMRVGEIALTYVDDISHWHVMPEQVNALAREVQQGRARRCSNCESWRPDLEFHAMAGACQSQRNRFTAHNHFCADFASKTGGAA